MTDTRQMPQSLEAERAVLGAILVNNAAYDLVSSLLQPRDFFRMAHQLVYATIGRLLASGPADLVTLSEALQRQGQLEDVGGPVYVAGLVDRVPHSMNAEHYAAIVKEKASLRAAIASLSKVVDEAFIADRPARELFIAADRALVDLQANNGAGRMLGLRDTQQKLLADLEWRRAHAGEVTGINTGFAPVNEITLGWQPGELIVVGARPSIGKTSYVMNAATAAAMNGKRIAVFSLEMRRIQLEYRLLASLSGVPLSRCLSGHFMDSDWGPLTHATGIMADLPIYINDSAGLTTWDIRSDCRRLRAEVGLDLVAIDYAQLIASSLDRKGATKNDIVSDISYRLKTLADELQVPVLLLSQLSRAGEKRDDPWPQLSDLRESGSLEQDADIVVFLHRKKHTDGGLTYLILAKQRNGPTGTFKLNFDKAVVTFSEWTGPEPSEEEPASKPTKIKSPKVARIG